MRCTLTSPFCCRFHSFETSHARKVLEAHNLGGLRSERQILSVLQSNRASSLDSDSSDDDAFYGFLATGGKEKSKPTSPTSYKSCFPVLDDSVGEKTEICGFNLRGKCSYGSRCNAVHSSKYAFRPVYIGDFCCIFRFDFLFLRM